MNIVNTQNTERELRLKENILAVLGGLSLTNCDRFLEYSTEGTLAAAHLPKATIDLPEQVRVIVKTVKNAAKISTRKKTLELFSNFTKGEAPIFLITPDDSVPEVLTLIEEIGVLNAHWTTFTMVYQAIEQILSNRSYFVSDIETSLLLKLRSLIQEENLAFPSDLDHSRDLDHSHDVVIVASRMAYDFFNVWDCFSEFNCGIPFVCRPSDSFEHADRLGFYVGGGILNIFPKILESFEIGNFQSGVNKELFGRLVNKFFDWYPEWEGEREADRCRILRLSHPKSKDTLIVPNNIPNDLRSRSGQRMALTFGHLFVSSDALKKAKTTSDLV